MLRRHFRLDENALCTEQVLRRHFRLDENAPCTEQGGDAAAGQEQRAGEGEGESEEWWRAPAGWRADAGPCYVLQEGAPPPPPPVLTGHVSSLTPY